MKSQPVTVLNLSGSTIQTNRKTFLTTTSARVYEVLIGRSLDSKTSYYNLNKRNLSNTRKIKIIFKGKEILLPSEITNNLKEYFVKQNSTAEALEENKIVNSISRRVINHLPKFLQSHKETNTVRLDFDCSKFIYYLLGILYPSDGIQKGWIFNEINSLSELAPGEILMSAKFTSQLEITPKSHHWLIYLDKDLVLSKMGPGGDITFMEPGELEKFYPYTHFFKASYSYDLAINKTNSFSFLNT